MAAAPAPAPSSSGATTSSATASTTVRLRPVCPRSTGMLQTLGTRQWTCIGKLLSVAWPSAASATRGRSLLRSSSPDTGPRTTGCRRSNAVPGERHAGPHEVIAGTTCEKKGRSSTRVCRRPSGSRDEGVRQAQLDQGGEIASWEPRLRGKEDAARPGYGSGQGAATKEGATDLRDDRRPAHGEGAWGNGRSTCDALRREMKEGAPGRPLRRATSYPSRSFSGTGRPAEAQCTQPVTCYREGRRARRTPTLFQKIPLGRPPESEARSVTVHPGSGTGPPGF